METTPAAKERNELFQKLKPCCVQVSQLAIREAGDPKSHRQVLQLVDQILDILNQQISTNPLALDEKLAEYVFFPLHHIFRQLERYPMSVVEDCVKILTILIVHGWKTKISAKLVQQIFSFLIFIIDGVPGSQKRDIPEETVLEAFRAETALLTTAGSSPVAAAGLSEPESIPALGHGITVMLDGVAEGASAEIQHEALRSLEAVYGAIKEHAALASFLPGTISSLAKVLSKPSRYKKLVLARCLGTVRVVLTRVLSDMRTRSILAKESESQSHEDKSKVLSPAWLKATVAQVQVALSVMMKLRTHEAVEVREALGRLCVALLDECHTTLANCTNILVETSVILDKGPDEDSMTETNLRYLINIYPELGESVKSTVYNWMSSLPRLVQASDEKVKEQAVYNLTKGIELLRSLRIESSTLDDSISSTLRESLMAVVSASKEQQTNTGNRVLLLDDGSPASAAPSQSDFQPVILGHEGQRRLKSEIMDLARTVASTSQHTKIAANMLDCVRESASLSQLTAYWLCFELVKASHAASKDTDALFDLSAFTDQSDDINQVFDELYDFSVQVLDSHTETAQVDWRLEAIALEIMAYAAHRSGENFRPELVDVLFPVATFLGSENANLQQHAITTLNSIALSCRYSSVSELIIDNVDYMVNSVSLRLNTLDISPASTQVLRMMVRLAGPRLVPFLDDVVESMFAALENYHGYTSFVESLFSVLKEIVDQASQADGRLLTEAEMSSINHKKKAEEMENLDMLLEFLDRRKEREERDRAEMEGLEPTGGHPGIPWTSGLAQGQDEQDGGQDQEMPPPEEEKKPNSPTYQLLQRVASLTQHYLTSPTPTLRRSLLELVTTASSVLAADQDAFLPLVNAIWPVVIARLHDPETFVVVEACEALSGLCKAAGDFLSTRWKTEWWDGLGNWCRKVKQQASGSKARTSVPLKSSLSQSLPQVSGGGGLGQYASPIRTWEAVVKLLTAIVSYVRVEDDMFDEILELLAEAMERDRDVRDALEVINADAVWVVRYERGLVEWRPAPVMEGVVFPEMERVS
ncbi:uncharacterized protein TRIREDRAFT_4936 [Trichoderma reesei QM6a]|uniref:Predicted protein n=2 Tax=Hypocrea jecorina TaxID=51453 RepID=G0RQB3_HYPJQ|nr:uncharacterized protein TRIREDRAFT_4936 [Trichoderma reesei QM6a]EGR46503.1 predicted protein [Trichoderma reesei QM6a]ETS00258.1 hypothetical protein M419DRAFT_131852 [Trichoderma reesei RUT C-30]